MFGARASVTGEKIERTWLCYSPSSGRVFCFICKLFSHPENWDRNPFIHGGYNDWKNANSCIKRHENNPEHRNAAIDLTMRSKLIGRVDSLVVKHNAECAYPRSILERVGATIKFLAERGLPFRGHDEVQTRLQMAISWGH